MGDSYQHAFLLYEKEQLLHVEKVFMGKNIWVSSNKNWNWPKL